MDLDFKFWGVEGEQSEPLQVPEARKQGAQSATSELWQGCGVPETFSKLAYENAILKLFLPKNIIRASICMYYQCFAFMESVFQIN